MNPRIVHDEAWNAATAIISALEPVLLPHEVRDAHELVFNRVKLAIELAYLEQRNETRRIKPSRN